MPRFEIRAALPEDEAPLLTLAGHLNTVNLPNDRAHIRDLLDLSERSFNGQITDSRKRKYVFILWDSENASAIGTSTLIAKLGQPDAPYIYFDVIPEEKYSKLTGKHFHHTLLRLGFSYDGPTELGGLVVLPSYRGERLGLFVSYLRFIYIAVRRDLFESELLAELLPPLEPDGTSHLWEALGRRFTEMTYSEADLLSSRNKDFIRDLFPGGTIYASVLSADAEAVIGKVGKATRGVEKMLRQVGFRYAERVDPFDGGPHFTAKVDEVSAVTDTRVLPYGGEIAGSPTAPEHGIVARFSTEKPYLRAVKSSYAITDATLLLPLDTAEHLGVGIGDSLACLAMPTSGG